MADGDFVVFAGGNLFLVGGVQAGVDTQGAEGSLEERGAGQFVAAFGHLDAAFPLARGAHARITAEVGLQFVGRSTFVAPLFPAVRQAGDDGRGAFFTEAGKGLGELDVLPAAGVARGLADVAGELGEQFPQRFDEPQLRVQRRQIAALCLAGWSGLREDDLRQLGYLGFVAIPLAAWFLGGLLAIQLFMAFQVLCWVQKRDIYVSRSTRAWIAFGVLMVFGGVVAGFYLDPSEYGFLASIAGCVVFFRTTGSIWVSRIIFGVASFPPGRRGQI